MEFTENLPKFEPGYTGDGFTHQCDEDEAEQEACDLEGELFRMIEGCPLDDHDDTPSLGAAWWEAR